MTIFDVDKLDDIEGQIKQLNIAQTLMFCILKIGIKATHFYYDSSLMGYSTSFEPIVPLTSFSLNQFNDYLRDKTPNYPWRGMYITGFDVFDSYLIIQHNTPLSDAEISAIKVLVNTSNERYNFEMNEFNDRLKLNQEFNE